MSKITNDYLPAQPIAYEQTNSHTFYDKIVAIFHKIVDCLIYIKYVIEYRINTFLDTQPSFFEGRVLCSTHNYGKFSELWDYVHLRRNPIAVPETTKKFFSQHGFTCSNTHVELEPYAGGMCQGGSLFFLKQWFETGRNIMEVSSLFDGGVPLTGALYQKIYADLTQETFYPLFVQRIIETIDHYPSPPEINPSYARGEPIIQGVQAYLAEDLSPDDEEMVEWVCKWVKNQHSLQVSGYCLASLRKAALHYHEHETANLRHDQFSHQMARLNSEVILYDTLSQNFLEILPTLSEGAYHIRLPVYNSGWHSIALVIQDVGFSFLYDPNHCISYLPREKIQPIMGRLFKNYGNHLRKGSRSGFQLYNITAASH